MKSRFGVFLMLFTLTVAAGLGINVGFTHANPLQTQGTSITVDTNQDLLSDDGFCSLREAVQSANLDSAIGGCPAGDGRDTIYLDSAIYSLVITNSIEGQEEDAAYTGDLDITDDLIIRGVGRSATILSASNLADRVFHVDPGEVGIFVKIYDLTIQDGIAYEDDRKGGGGVLTSGKLLLNGLAIANNQAQRGGGVRVTHSGSLEILNSVIEGNTAAEQGGGVYGNAPIGLDTVQIIENGAPLGGGLFCDLVCQVLDVSISRNDATSGGSLGGGKGGGVYIDHPSEFINVTFDNNSANKQGGGIFSQADLTLTNSTFSENSATNEGSAMYMSDATAHLINVTISGNAPPTGAWAGLVSESADPLYLVNTIIVDNGPNNCSGDFSSYGNNIASDDTCDLTHDTDLTNTDPLLDVLQDNGGKTKTYALLPNSPAIDYGNDDLCASIDQRSFPRPTDGNLDGQAQCDVGAYESVPAGVVSIDPIEYNEEEFIGSLNIR